MKITISDNDAHSTDVFYHQWRYNNFTLDYKLDESNREDKNSVEEATAKKSFNTTKNTSDELKILLSSTGFVDWN